MDPATAFVNAFVSQLVIADKARENLFAWYMWTDKRPGTPADNFAIDAKDFNEYVRMFRP
jgi:hypothetical protein